MQLAIHLITLHNFLEYMQIAILKTKAAELVKINICIIFKTFGHGCIYVTRWWNLSLPVPQKKAQLQYVRQHLDKTKIELYGHNHNVWKGKKGLI